MGECERVLSAYEQRSRWNPFTVTSRVVEDLNIHVM